MKTVHVSYHHQHGWSVIDATEYEKSVMEFPSFTSWQQRTYLNDGDSLKLRATFERGLKEDALYGLTHRAEKWLIEAGYARKVAGLLLVDWKAVNRELERLAAEHREGV